MKALEILKACRERGQKRDGGLVLDEAIAELEELMKSKSCDGCKWEHIKGNNWSCKDCRRSPSFVDMYEPKETL